MEIQKLLKPRYRVIASYPSSGYEVGSTIENIGENYCMFLNEYPHLFRKLEWWEERKESDLPKYVKDKNEVFEIHIKSNGSLDLHPTSELAGTTNNQILHLTDILPATKEEYETFKNKS